MKERFGPDVCLKAMMMLMQEAKSGNLNAELNRERLVVLTNELCAFRHEKALPVFYNLQQVMDGELF
jgi:hypothetical protein